jgi:hypothetical protein
MLRPGNAGANTAADHITVLDRALEQIPARYIETIEILVRADSAGATHALADHCREGNMRFSFGYELIESVRAAILESPPMVGLRRSTKTAASARTARSPRSPTASSSRPGRSDPG